MEKIKQQEILDDIEKHFAFMKALDKHGVLIEYLMLKFDVTRQELEEKDLFNEQ